MDNWKDMIAEGINLIIEGCKENSSWLNCRECPFDTFCTSIYIDNKHNFSTPDTWEEEGYEKI